MTSSPGVYIHIPFCRHICSYCDFCKVLYNSSWAKAYLQKLKEEIKENYMGEEVKTIYIGGGTPSVLSLEEIEYLLNLTNLFLKNNLQEFTFECNIEDITEELLILLKKYGVNRLSIGIESFDLDNQKLLQRVSVYDDAKSKIALARSLGFNNINLDLIYAIPHEKMRTLKNDLKDFLSLKVEHISTYSLMIEDNTYLSYKKVHHIPEELDEEMYFYIEHILEKYGYEHYEVSNFALPGYASMHNLGYWNNSEYYGFGCGASGYISGVRYDNTRSLSNYLKGDIRLNKEILSKDDIMEYELILGLRKLEGINIKEFYNKYGINIQDKFKIKPLLKTKELLYEDGQLKINPDYIYVMNEILVKLV